jgi:predicted ATPase
MIKENCFILTGAPGSGKSSILNSISQKGVTCVPEFARAIIAQQRAIDGNGLYDKNPQLFKELMLSRAINDFIEADIQTPCLFDRGIPDLLAYSDCFDISRGVEVKAAELYQYNKIVFFTPSWEEIYSNDEDRRISFHESKLFGNNIKSIYQTLGYKLIELPYASVDERTDFLIDFIGSTNDK